MENNGTFKGQEKAKFKGDVKQLGDMGGCWEGRAPGPAHIGHLTFLNAAEPSSIPPRGFYSLPRNLIKPKHLASEGSGNKERL